MAWMSLCQPDRAHRRGSQAFSRFPSWMWRNVEVCDFTRWLHRYNRTLPADQRIEFRGLDVYSLRNSIGEVLAYLDSTDPQLAREARRRYGCLTPWQDDPVWHSVERGHEAFCEEHPEPADPRDEEEQRHDLDDDTPDPAKGNEQEAEDIARKIAEIERKVADRN
ncbi:erythromycin esterase [Pseudomonas chlororaphis]|uniref:Erythromycin esterase family protein n=1 Tax=Pseudomonas chlororaphis TaxID=587753 RepID=A0AAP9VQF4_9PSED|nr:erythromycin esterase [Pseudomonas chlororaphis]AUG41247.1 erythromycin esterase [Pseudomonas chlororaphis]QNR45099.1 erythromycin esterase family protein [Pseudomonas chlororaphis]